jgi:hypothetical protein
MKSEIENMAEHFECKKYAYRQTKDGVVLSFVLHPDDIPPDMAVSAIGSRYMVACVQINDQEEPMQAKAKNEGERALSRACLICKDADYQTWVRLNAEKWGIKQLDLEDEELCALVIRNVCRVGSRSEIKTSPSAQQRLNLHLQDFLKRDKGVV